MNRRNFLKVIGLAPAVATAIESAKADELSGTAIFHNPRTYKIYAGENTNPDFYFGEQWTEQELDAMRQRPAERTVFNLIKQR